MRRRHTIVACLIGCGVVAAPLMLAAPPPEGNAQSAEHSATAQADATAAKPAGGDAGKRKYATELLAGKVVWLADALERRFGVRTEPAAAESAVVLETPQGHLIPLVPDTRGWAFVVDEHLRDIDLQLLVRRYEGAPHVQVIRVLKPKDDGLYEVDYWCDICAIPMYILKPCECCQGQTRLREQKLEPGQEPKIPAADR